MPLREMYRRDRKKWSAAESRRRRAKWPRVSAEELERLRLPENRLEALGYGLGKKQLVCLNCAGIFDGNFSRHPSACSQKPRSAEEYGADEYKDQWGYNKSARLTSAEWHTRKSQTLAKSPRFQAAQAKNQPAALEAFAAERHRRSAVGQPVRRGPQRLQTILAKCGRRLDPRPDRQKVSDTVIQRVMALDLPIAVAAQRAGLSQTAYYRRIQKLGWTASEVRARRSLIARYLFDLRTWSRQQAAPPTLDQILQRHSAGLRGEGAAAFAPFTPYVAHLETELQAKPDTISQVAQRFNGSAIITLAARIFQRSRRRTPRGAPKKQKPDYAIFGEMVQGKLRRFRDGFALLAKAKKERPTSSRHWSDALKQGGFSEQEASSIVASRKPESAAIRWAAERESKSLKTGKNYWTLFQRSLVSKPNQSPEQ
jgi:hypothetical protein